MLALHAVNLLPHGASGRGAGPAGRRLRVLHARRCPTSTPACGAGARTGGRPGIATGGCRGWRRVRESEGIVAQGDGMNAEWPEAGVGAGAPRGSLGGRAGRERRRLRRRRPAADPPQLERGVGVEALRRCRPPWTRSWRRWARRIPTRVGVIGDDVRETLRKLAEMGLVSEAPRVVGARLSRPAAAPASCRCRRALSRMGRAHRPPARRRRPRGSGGRRRRATARSSSRASADAALLERIESELRPFLEATPTGPDDFSGQLTRRTGSLIARSAACRDLVMHPLALGAARAFLGHATNIQLHLTQAIAIGPGETAQPIHRDQWAFDFFPFPAGYEVQCNTIWALTDFTEENGATRVVVGSNAREDRASPSAPTTPSRPSMPRGSVLFYSGSVYHGGGANDSACHPDRAQHHVRRGLVAPGGEPVPLGASRGGRDAAGRPAAA